MPWSKRMLASAVLVLMVMKPIPTVTTRHRNISLKTKVNFDIDSSFSKPILTKYYDTYQCEGENDCPGDYDTTTQEPIKKGQPMWKINSEKESGTYRITQTIISFAKNEKSFGLPQVTGHISS